jgi:hypothetical protein
MINIVGWAVVKKVYLGRRDNGTAYILFNKDDKMPVFEFADFKSAYTAAVNMIHNHRKLIAESLKDFRWCVVGSEFNVGLYITKDG